MRTKGSQQALWRAKAFLFLKKVQGQIQKGEKQRKKGTQDDLTRCPGTEPDLRGPGTSHFGQTSAPILIHHKITQTLAQGHSLSQARDPVSGSLVHFLPFWRAVIHADHLVFEVVSQGYTIKLLGSQEHSSSMHQTRCSVQRGG